MTPDQQETVLLAAVNNIEITYQKIAVLERQIETLFNIIDKLTPKVNSLESKHATFGIIEPWSDRVI